VDDPTLSGEATSRSAEVRVFRVREINFAVARMLDERIGRIRVEGELSGWRRHTSGHCYFALREARAELRCVLYRSSVARLRFDPADGQSVVASGRLTIYMDRGIYQLVVDRLEPAGEGALLARLEALKARLGAEGLFDESRKRSLPRVPRVLGVVTSRSGAAFADIVRVARSRWPGVEIVLAPVRVQGEGAGASVARGIGSIVRHGRADVIIVGRGGGSIEDLWAFNDEIVVRAIAASPIPVVSAVGHETDVTLSDLAADVRAATPSRAAEICVPDRATTVAAVRDRRERLHLALERRLVEERRRLERLVRSHGLNRPRTVVEHAMQRVDDLQHRLHLATRRLVPDRRDITRDLVARLVGAAREHVEGGRRETARAATALRIAGERIGSDRRPRLAALGASLGALSPMRVLERGYAIITGADGTLVTNGADLREGDRVDMRFRTGGAEARVIAGWAYASREGVRGSEGDDETS
jgi:exodeoxyribonuclease VII large subunit